MQEAKIMYLRASVLNLGNEELILVSDAQTNQRIIRLGQQPVKKGVLTQ